MFTSEQKPCAVVIAHFVYGSQTCSILGDKTVPGEFPTDVHVICDEHFELYLKQTKPKREEYSFWNEKENSGYDADDFDEELYHDDVRWWESIRDQTWRKK